MVGSDLDLADIGNNPKNLHLQMANPRGQQRDKPFLAALRLEIAAAQDDDDQRSLRRIARMLLGEASGGDVSAIKEVADRLDGKVPQAITGEDGGPVQVEVVKFAPDA